MSFQDWHKEFDKFWPEHSKVSKIFTLTVSFWAKYMLFELKKVQRSYLSWNWKDMQILKKNWLVVWKILEKFGKYSPEHLKVSKLKLWLDYFFQSRKGMTLKFTGELYVMTMKNNAKFEEKLTCHFKIDMRNLANEFWLEHSKI